MFVSSLKNTKKALKKKKGRVYEYLKDNHIKGQVRLAGKKDDAYFLVEITGFTARQVDPTALPAILFDKVGSAYLVTTTDEGKEKLASFKQECNTKH